MMEMKTIALDEIDHQDRLFRTSWLRDKAALQRSISEAGVVVPLWVKERKGQKGYQLISGFRRLDACLALEIREVPACVQREEGLDEFHIYKRLLHENLHCRGYNLIERALVITTGIERFGLGKAAVAEQLLPLLGVEPAEPLVDAYAAIARLDPSLKTYIVEEEVSLSNAQRLARFPSEDQQVLASVLPFLKLGENTLREALENLEDIKWKERRGLAELLSRPCFRSLIEDPAMTKPARTMAFRGALKELRYPTLHKMEKSFRERVKGLSLPPCISLIHPPFFEEEGFLVRFRVTSSSDFTSGLKKLSAIKEEEIDHLLRLSKSISS